MPTPCTSHPDHLFGMLGEPLLALGEVGQRKLDAGPEFRRVVRLAEMDELVDGDVLDDPLRQQDGAPA